MRVARTIKGLTHGNALVLRKVKVYFQRFPGTNGTDAERGIADAEYTFKVGGRVVDKGKTAADGSIEVMLPIGPPAELVVFGTTYALHVVNHVGAATQPAARMQRLSLLGYELGAVDGVWGKEADRAALNFQGDQGLSPDGVVDAATQNKLTSIFGE